MVSENVVLAAVSLDRGMVLKIVAASSRHMVVVVSALTMAVCGTAPLGLRILLVGTAVVLILTKENSAQVTIVATILKGGRADVPNGFRPVVLKVMKFSALTSSNGMIPRIARINEISLLAIMLPAPRNASVVTVVTVIMASRIPSLAMVGTRILRHIITEDVTVFILI